MTDKPTVVATYYGGRRSLRPAAVLARVRRTHGAPPAAAGRGPGARPVLRHRRVGAAGRARRRPVGIGAGRGPHAGARRPGRGHGPRRRARSGALRGRRRRDADVRAGLVRCGAVGVRDGSSSTTWRSPCGAPGTGWRPAASSPSRCGAGKRWRPARRSSGTAVRREDATLDHISPADRLSTPAALDGALRRRRRARRRRSPSEHWRMPLASPAAFWPVILGTSNRGVLESLPPDGAGARPRRRSTRSSSGAA